MVTGNQNFSEYFLETQNLFFFLVGNHFYQNLFIKVKFGWMNSKRSPGVCLKAPKKSQKDPELW